ncbi:hypothetical protein [Streptomyces javensis]|uniref:Uncharacterized protein n=1 Tax=Streptomyces javensis TaxID=114698 RepID=A0ABS0R3R8_9ACTN|nr:hypothetical protein [Streptomyces javensis]MBI0312012.1 hypothetical protein [Streptomyces javensis]
MSSAPIVVHSISGVVGGRRVTAYGRVLGWASSDPDLVGFLRRTGLTDPETLLDGPAWVEWRRDGPHQWTAA